MDRYSKIEVLKSQNGNRYYKNTFYPTIPLSENDLYIITGVGDRLDVLSQQYYNDATLYWILLSANPELDQASLFPSPGSQLRIPTDLNQIISDFNSINSL